MLKTEIGDQGCTTVTMARPDVHNAFDEELIGKLKDNFSKLAVNLEVRLIVITTTGLSFCAGADLNWMKQMSPYSYEKILAGGKALAEMLHTIATCPKSIIGKVQDPAYGGGVGIVSVFDIAIASENTRFVFSEVKLVITPATISPYVVAAIGERQAYRYFLNAEMFDAWKAVELGLVHQVVPPEKLVSTLDKLVDKMLRSSPAVMVAAKKLVRNVAKKPINQNFLEDTAKHIADIRPTAEGKEGIKAFLEKRKPSWIYE